MFDITNDRLLSIRYEELLAEWCHVFSRDSTGSCEWHGSGDHGVHTVCAQMTREFLEFTRSRGNDLSTPSQNGQFPGLRPGDRWCLCAARWKEALNAKMAPPVVLRATHRATLQHVKLNELRKYAVGNSRRRVQTRA